MLNKETSKDYKSHISTNDGKSNLCHLEGIDTWVMSEKEKNNPSKEIINNTVYCLFCRIKYCNEFFPNIKVEASQV